MNSYLSNNMLISLLKQYNVKNLVLSSGTRNIPFVMAVENDDDFECFSVIDERNAAFFALGLSQQINEPIAIACTSGTAASNYISGVTEAYYSHSPIVIITFDRSPYMYKQLETQKIDQITIFQNITKRSVSLPVIKDKDDAWYCQRLLNEAFISLNQHGQGPVHINIPIVGITNEVYRNSIANDSVYMTNKIQYVDKCDEAAWNRMCASLKKKRKILIVIGYNLPFKEEKAELISAVIKKMRCPVLADNMSNFRCDEFILAGPVIKALNSEGIEKILPELVITFGDNFQERIKDLLRTQAGKFEHWSIDETGEIRDCFKSQTALFECSPTYFFENAAKRLNDFETDGTYLDMWRALSGAITLPDMPFTNFLTINKFVDVLPRNSLLHLSILNATRIMQFYNLDKSIKVFSNVNAFGIDGCLPAFIGQAYAFEGLAFLVIGDLSFFYGMNALGIKHRKSNIRVLLINNGGGAEFHIQPDTSRIETIDRHIGAAHNRTAKGWAESLDYEYLTANDELSLTTALESFVSVEHTRPVLLEVFTNMKRDGEFCLEVYRHAERCITALLNDM